MDNVCYVLSGSCVALGVSGVAPLAGVGCLSAGSTCFISETLDRMPGCGDSDIRVYLLSWYIPGDHIVIPECVGDEFNSIINDVVQELISIAPFSAESEIQSDTSTSWKVNPDFLDEWDLESEFDEIPKLETE